MSLQDEHCLYAGVEKNLDDLEKVRLVYGSSCRLLSLANNHFMTVGSSIRVSLLSSHNTPQVVSNYDSLPALMEKLSASKAEVNTKYNADVQQ